MKKKMITKTMAMLLTLVFVLSSLAGCAASGKSSDNDQTTTTDKVEADTDSTEEVKKERKKVDFWYLWGGEEGKIIEKIIAAYNESQDTYEVVGLSTPDQQKILTAISGGNGPDIVDDFGGNVPKYATEGIAMALDDFISAENFDTSGYVDAALAQQVFEGKTYALPISTNVYALYYNKDILEQAGITELPKTLEELISMSEQTTKMNGEEVEVLGSPFVTDSYWYYSYTYAMGGNFGTSVDSLTPDNDAFLSVLDYAKSQADKFGTDAITNFISSGNAKRYTPEDPFCTGNQAFRIDGPWFYAIASDSGVNFDIMPLPGSSKQGGDGYSMIDTSNMYIPTTAKEPEGAWDFAKYITIGAGAEIFVKEKGDLPAAKALASDESIINSRPHYKVYLDIINKNKLYSLPPMSGSAVYDQNLKQAVSSVLLGNSVEDAKAQLLQSMVTVQ